MKFATFLLMLSIVVKPEQAVGQNIRYRSELPVGYLTASSGSPIPVEEGSSLNSNLLRHTFLMDSMTHLTRERIPERVAHGRGSGAFGYFEVTADLRHICKAKLFNAVGKKTPVAVRFSPVSAGRGSIDTTRDIRGFAIKFYTEEGNFDFVGLNSPAFSIKDPLLFPAFVHALNPNPASNVHDPNMIWDFITQRPESMLFMLTLFSDRGITNGYRFMPGFSIHTYELVNEAGIKSYVRFHFIPDGGLKNLRLEEAQKITGLDQDYASRDLYNAIDNGNYPSWTAAAQILSIDDIIKATTNPFDVTKILPEDKYPLYNFGKLILNRNPVNYFAEIEQLAYCPGNIVPGINGAPDKLFEARIFAYRDTQNYRLGVNFNKIQVNCPFNPTYTYNRDGRAPVKDNEGNNTNYFPNSFNGPVINPEITKTKIIEIIEDDSGNIEQARDLYLYGFTAEERSTIVTNIVDSLKDVVSFIQDRAIKVLYAINPELGRNVAFNLQTNNTILTYRSRKRLLP